MIDLPLTAVAPGPNSIAWRVIGDRRALLSAGRALLLQVAHPVVGSGVIDHSNFQLDPWGRLRRTIDSLLAQVYGGAAATAEAARLISLHRGIKGTDLRGQYYSALDPEAYAWVHLTIFDTAVRFRPYFAAPLTPDEELQFYAEWRELGRLLGIPDEYLPFTLAEFWSYFEHNLEHRLEKNQAVHELLNSLSGEGTPPPYGWIPSFVWRGVAPLAGRINRLATIGLLPVSLRDRWGLPWSTADQRRLCLLSAVVRFVFARLPLRWRYFSVAARAIAK